MILSHHFVRSAAALLVLGLLLPTTACTSPTISAAPDTALSRQSVGLRDRLASDNAERANMAEARARLSFTPIAPQRAAGRSLATVYTRADADDIKGGQDLKGKDNVLQVLYEDDILITERQWDPSVVPDEATYGKGLTENVGEYTHSTSFKGHTLWLIDSVNLPESTDANGTFIPGVTIEVSQVCWFVDGVSYIVGCPTLTADDLLPVAEAMIE